MRAAELIRAWDSLPFADPAELFPEGAPLVLAPHPDDESLGCGGIIAACRSASVVIVTDGAASHPGSRRWPAAELRRLREAEAREATRRLGLAEERLHFLGLPDSAAPHNGPEFDAAVGAIAAIAGQQRCSAILATWGHDPHRDHQATAAMARAAARLARLPLYFYPVWGWTLPDDAMLPPGAGAEGWRVRIAAQLDAKRAAIAAHRSQTTDMIADATIPWHVPPEMRQIFERPFEVLLRGT